MMCVTYIQMVQKKMYKIYTYKYSRKNTGKQGKYRNGKT